MIEEKKKRWVDVYFFFSINEKTKTATMIIAMNKPADTGRKYWSAIDAGAAVGAGVAAGESMTWKAVSEDDCQFDSVPANVATTL